MVRIEAKENGRLEWKVYRRKLKIPLSTAKGTTTFREGILLRRESESGLVQYGEIAPWAEFGSERLEEVIQWLKRMGENERIWEIPGGWNSTLFAFESLICPPSCDTPMAKVVSLATVGNGLENASARALASGFEVQKWKVGLGSYLDEMRWVERALEKLPHSHRVRLDANQSLDFEAWKAWSQMLRAEERVEFMEEPMKVSLASAKAIYASDAVKVGLDESLMEKGESKKGELKIENLDWSGYYVMKPSLQGEAQRWVRGIDREHYQKVVLSSVFETGIGVSRLIRLGADYRFNPWLGLGTLGYFDDGLSMDFGPEVRALALDEMEAIWKRV